MIVLLFLSPLLLFVFWMMAVTFVGFLVGDRKMPLKVTKEYSFAVLICAHNEGQVVGKLLESLAKQSYNPAKFHVFLLADHCDDDTVAIGNSFPNVTVKEHRTGERTGKGAVLSYGINEVLPAYEGDFEAIVCFDADNVADKYFLEAINRKFNEGSDIVMGNRLSLNPYASLVSKWYTLYWHTVDVLFSHPRSKIGLPVILSGTGFAFKRSLLGHEGWQTVTITEDIEFSMQQNLQGVFAHYCGEAVFYDEQPTTLKVMFSQLRRWCTGNYQIAWAYKAKWWQVFSHKPAISLIDNFVPICLCVFFGFFLLITTGFSIHYFFDSFTDPIGQAILISINILWWGSWYVVSVIVGSYVTVKQHFSLVKMLPGILTAWIFCVLFALISVYSLFRPQKTWVPIKHEHKM